MADRVSADTDRLDAFAAVARDDRTTMVETLVELEAGRAGLANLPLPFFVDATPLVRYGELTEAMAGTGGYAADVSLALQTFGVDLGDGRYSAAGSVIARELDRSNAERLDDFEQELVDQGVSQEEAAKIAAEVDAALEADPSLSFGDAVLAGIAAYEGVTVDELLQRRRAYDLYPAEVGAVIDENFDLIAGQTGDPDSITTGDLLLTIENEDLPQEVRDAAYRLAADSVLFNNMDVAHQTDLSDEPLTNGFAWDDADGVIGRDDAAEFPAKDYQARILLGWHPLIETAADGYDLSRGDSHASADDVIAFVEDDDIPIYIRLAVFDVYAERHGLDLERRIELEQELALDAGGLAVGGRTVLDAGVSFDGRGSGRPAPALPGVSGGGRAGARGPGGPGGGGTLAAVYVELLTISISAGWNAGHRARIARDGEPTFVYTDPLTGAETELDPIVLVGLTPAEAKAYVAHFTTHGTPPPVLGDTIEPHPYLDADGQWRMSDTGEVIHTLDGPQNLGPGQQVGIDGELYWIDTGQPVKDHPNRPLYLDDDGVLRFGDTGRPVASPLNWDPKSRPTFGHTFSRHGAGERNSRRLNGRAAGTGRPQGQWLNDAAAAEFLRSVFDPWAGARTLPLPEGLGQVIMPDGSVLEATHVTVWMKPDGTIRTAYPVIRGSE